MPMRTALAAGGCAPIRVRRCTSGRPGCRTSSPRCRRRAARDPTDGDAARSAVVRVLRRAAGARDRDGHRRCARRPSDSPPAARTVAATPPGMFSAVSSVFGSPIAMTMYGARSVRAVDDDRAAWLPVNAVDGRSPGTAELDRLGPGAAQLLDDVEQVLGRELAAGSVTVTCDAGAGGRQRAEQDAERRASCWACWRAAADRSPLSCSRRSVCLQVGDLLPQPVGARVLVVEDADQVVLAQVGEVVAGRSWRAPAPRSRSRAAREHADDAPPMPRVEPVRAAACVGACGGWRARRPRVRPGTGAGGSRRRCRRCGCRARRPPRSTAGCRRRACRPGRRSARRPARSR